jgi:hypothetical protein
MGQYFKAVIENNSGDRYALNSGGVGKFMEFSYALNPSMLCIVEHLAQVTKTVPIKYTHNGDYSENYPHYETDVDAAYQEAFDKAVKQIDAEYNNNKELLYQRLINKMMSYTLYNHSKKEMVILQDYMGQDNYIEIVADVDMILSPLAMLCATEQGLGGGDFRNYFMGDNMEEGGRWLGDEISIRKSGAIGFEDITSMCVVTESTDDYEAFIFDGKISLEERKEAFGIY